MANTFLHGVGIGFYRGIGDNQLIGPFSDLNFFVGANNAGKSIVLNFIHERLPFKEGPAAPKIEPGSPETYRGRKASSLLAAVGVPPEVLAQATQDQKGTGHTQIDPRSGLYVGKAVAQILDRLQYRSLIWMNEVELFNAKRTNGKADYQAGIEDLVEDLWSPDVWRALWTNLTGKMGGELRAHWIPQTLNTIRTAARPNFPPSKLIPAKRTLGPKDESFDDQTGKGLIDELARLQSPGHHEREERQKFDAINSFVQEVTGKPDAVIEVPHDRAYLQVHIDNKVLPLDSLGTGLHEVILIAAFCTINQDRIICIEEPEIHLHPLLQRKLIAYLRDRTSNQYFIATHSAAFIDTPGASVFRVENDGVQTRVEQALLRQQKWQICDDLGYRASDILQANFVIWVEGPSDRIYLNHWLAAVAPDLREGIDYTIMFFGGGLVSHLSADGDEDALQQLIDLRTLNRNMAIVMDSDKSSSRARLKDAPKRLKEEASDDWAMVWITKGREIENYVDHTRLQAALKDQHPRIYGEPCAGGPYDHAFYFTRKASSEVCKTADKIAAARTIAREAANLDILDLRERVSELAKLIRSANQT